VGQRWREGFDGTLRGLLIKPHRDAYNSGLLTLKIINLVQGFSDFWHLSVPFQIFTNPLIHRSTKSYYPLNIFKINLYVEPKSRPGQTKSEEIDE